MYRIEHSEILDALVVIATDHKINSRALIIAQLEISNKSHKIIQNEQTELVTERLHANRNKRQEMYANSWREGERWKCDE